MTVPTKRVPAPTMPVILTIHGGQNGLQRVLDGLVERNARSIRDGAPKLSSFTGAATAGVQRTAPVAFAHEPIWRDIPNALRAGRASVGTLAAWRAAEALATGKDPTARVVITGGLPVAIVGGVQMDPSLTLGRRLGGPTLISSGALDGDPDEGLVQEHMLLTLDDDEALPVREVNTAIARHNAYRIKKKGLPGIYESGVRYKVEGLPELWWDAEQILSAGHDDCEGLAAYRAGELLAQGIQADVYTRRVQMPGGSPHHRIFHAVTRIQQPDKPVRYDDPSVRLGMPVPQWYSDYAKQRRARGLPL